MNARTKWRRLEIVTLASLMGGLASALLLRLFARSLPLATFVFIGVSGACFGAVLGSGALRSLVTSLRSSQRARRRWLVATALLCGGIFAGFWFWSSSWPLVWAIRYGNAGLQSWAEHKFRERGSDAIPGLFKILDGKDSLQHVRAAKLLGEIDPPPIAALLQVLEHKDPAVRATAARTLGRIATSQGLAADAPRVATALPPLLLDVNREPRLAAANALHYLNPPQKDAVPMLAEIARTGDIVARRLATQVLASMGSAAEDSLPVLLDALHDPDEQIRVNALNALWGMGPAARDAVPTLIESLGHPDVWFRNAAARALRQIDPPYAVARLVKDLDDSDALVRLRSARALGIIGPDASDAIPALVQASHDTDECVRQAAIESLKQIDGREAESND